jgi:hypothetical protein
VTGGDAGLRERYASRAAAHAREADTERRRSLLISRLRLLTILPALTILAWALWRGATPVPVVIGVGLLASFAALVVWHARVEDRVAWLDARRAACEWGIARLSRDWGRLPAGDAPEGLDLSAHPYALDLDLFGRASLFRLLGPPATPGGARTLAGWLLAPAAPGAIAARQRAMHELSALATWREDLAAHGVLASAAREREIVRFVEWAEGGPTFGRHHRAVMIAVVAILGALWLGLLLQATGVIDVALWVLPMLVGIVLSFATAGTIQTTLDRAGSGQSALGRYAALFAHAVGLRPAAPLLAQIRERMSSEGVPAPACMRRLNRILGFGDLRRGAALLHFPIQALTLWDFHVVFALDRWRRHAGRRMRGWLEALSELDALAALGTAAHENPGWTLPRIASGPELHARALGHPLIRSDRRVPNDVVVGPPGTLLLVTGSNMSGKSTLLRSIGLNLVLAHAGGPVCAEDLAAPWCELQTSIRVQDSLELGLSYFMAALARLKGVVDAAEHERPGRVLFYLLDEILQGTNSVERAIAVRAVARHLLDSGAIGAMTTHDLSLAAEEPLENAARLVHFTEVVDEDGQMRFDYRLRPGLATSRNALRLMQLIGIDV